MMKRFFFFVLSACVLVSCNEPVADEHEVQFNVSNLSVLLDTTAREIDGGLSPVRMASPYTPEEAGLTDLWVIEGSKTLAHQVSTDNDFGTPTVVLSSGHHTLTFIGSGKTGQKVVSGVWSADKCSDTYGCESVINVQADMAVQNIVLSRVNYVLQWSSNDVVPNAADSCFVEVVGHRNTLIAGLAGGDANPKYVFGGDVNGRHGATVYININGFCAEFGVVDSVTTTFIVKNANKDTMYIHSATAPMLSNRKTVIKGNLFGSTKSAIGVNTSWLSDYEVEI